MKIDNYNIVPIYEAEKIVCFDISCEDKKFEEVAYQIKSGHLEIKIK